MLLVYYNDNYHVFYTVYKEFYDYDKYVGYKNSYNHEIVQILIFFKNELYSIQDYSEYHNLLHPVEKRRKKRNTLKRRIIRFLNKFDD